MKKVLQFIVVWCISFLLLAPTVIELVHTFHADHDHHFCMEEAKGEIHFHSVDFDCKFQPFFIAPFYFTSDHIPFTNSNTWIEKSPLILHVFYTKPFETNPYLRGPPIA